MGLFDAGRRKVEGLNAFGKEKTPPGQVATVKFPVLTYGDTPEVTRDEWQFRIWGEVEREIVWTWEEFMTLPQTTIRADFHCVTHWSRFDDEWSGVLFRDLLNAVAVKPSAAYVMQHAYGGYTTNNALAVMRDEEFLFAHTFNGAPLPREHGGPMRVFPVRRYAWKGAKWVNGLEFMREDRPGFWEQNGYNTPADPWNEERYG